MFLPQMGINGPHFFTEKPYLGFFVGSVLLIF